MSLDPDAQGYDPVLREEPAQNADTVALILGDVYFVYSMWSDHWAIFLPTS